MNKKVKIGLAAGLLALTAAAAATYHAWQEGWVPTSILAAHPRAPLPENFLAALQADTHIAKTLKPACLRLNLASTRGLDRMGRAGMSHQHYPGWDVIGIAQVPGEGGHRTDQLNKALEALAKTGFYAAVDSEHIDEAGARYKVKDYALTMAGWQVMREEQCFTVGTPTVAEVTEYSRVLSDTGSDALYEVSAAYKFNELAPWARDKDVQSLVSAEQIKALLKPVLVTARLRRSETGWKVESTPPEFPALDVDEALDLITRSRSSAPPEACIRLPVGAAETGFEIQPAPYAITLYEQDVRAIAGSALAARMMWQDRLAQLVRAGLFQEETVAADRNRATPAGTRYVLDPAYQKWLDINDAQCLKLGEVSTEILSVSIAPVAAQEGRNGKAAQALVRLLSRLEDNAWIRQKDLPLPEVEAVLNIGGVPAIAHLTWTDRSEDKAWRLANLMAPRIELMPSAANVAAAKVRMLAAEQLPSDHGSSAAITMPVAASAISIAGASETDVAWRPAHRGNGGGVSNAGLTATYCCAGASSAVLATRSIASGKVYAEFTLKTRPAGKTGDTYTSIGLIPGSVLDASGDVFILDTRAGTMAFRRGDEIANNDVIGLAIDLDRGELHISRNGAWLSSTPEGGGGVPLKPGRPQYVTAVISASSAAGGTDAWTANFGKSRFRYPIPRGYKSYDGRQRG